MPEAGVIEKVDKSTPESDIPYNPVVDAEEILRQHAKPDRGLSHLVTAANNEQAQQQIIGLLEDEKKPSHSSKDNPSDSEIAVTPTDTEQINQQLTEIEHLLAELEPKAKAGDTNVVQELAILLEEQGQLRKQLEEIQHLQQPRKFHSKVTSILDKFMARIFKGMNAPLNQPLETLRFLEVQEWRKARKASGKSDFLGIPSTLKAMVGMRNSPSELAANIKKYQASTTPQNISK